MSAVKERIMGAVTVMSEADAKKTSFAELVAISCQAVETSVSTAEKRRLYIDNNKATKLTITAPLHHRV